MIGKPIKRFIVFVASFSLITVVDLLIEWDLNIARILATFLLVVVSMYLIDHLMKLYLNKTIKKERINLSELILYFLSFSSFILIISNLSDIPLWKATLYVGILFLIVWVRIKKNEIKKD